MTSEQTRNLIENGGAVLGIEFGSTRIKAVLIGPDYEVLAQGAHEWENRLLDGKIWSYCEEDIWGGLAACYLDLKRNAQNIYGVTLKKLKAAGISAMMHGYLPFDEAGNLLVPFRTWRNTITGPAAEALTDLFHFNIPQRWSIAHLYQAILNEEPHVGEIRFLTTLAGYAHWRLTGEKVLGVGDASGMFPIDPATCDYNETMLDAFQTLIAGKGYPWTIREILPKSITAGAYAGVLTAEGARLLDPEGDLEPGCPLCPPEGDAGTGMTATNSVKKRTGNVSAGTSVFSMVVLEKPLAGVHKEIDVVTTPDGAEVAMVHCNNCTSDLNAWVAVFEEFAQLMGLQVTRGQLYESLYKHAMTGSADAGGLLSYNFLASEPVVLDEPEGRLIVARRPDSEFTLANFMKSLLYASLATLKVGNDILLKEEAVQIDRLMGHGGLFKTEGVGQNILAAAMHCPVTLMESAGEGGAWGIALLAAYLVEAGDGAPEKAAGEELVTTGHHLDLSTWLEQTVFAEAAGAQPKSHTVAPDPALEAGFDAYAERFVHGLAIQKAAVENM